MPDSSSGLPCIKWLQFSNNSKKIFLNYLNKFIFYTLPLLRIILKLFVLWLHREYIFYFPNVKYLEFKNITNVDFLNVLVVSLEKYAK